MRTLKKRFRYKVRVTAPGEQVVMVTARAKHLDPHEGWGNTFVTVINPERPQTR